MKVTKIHSLAKALQVSSPSVPPRRDIKSFLIVVDMPLSLKDSRTGQTYDLTYYIIKLFSAKADNNFLFGPCSDLSSPKISQSVHS